VEKRGQKKKNQRNRITARERRTGSGSSHLFKRLKGGLTEKKKKQANDEKKIEKPGKGGGESVRQEVQKKLKKGLGAELETVMQSRLSL